MMKKVRWLILLGLLLGGMVLPGVRADEPWDTIKKVVTLEPVMTMLGYSPTTINPMEGLVRFLILILLFAIIFAGAEMLKLGKGVSITIAAVFALISAIFIPGGVLLAIGASYGTLISVALLGVPVLGLLSSFFWLKDYPKVRIVVMAVGVWVLYQMQGHIGRLPSGTVTSDVVQALTWVTGAAWLGLVFAVIGWTMTWAGGSAYHPNAAGGLFDRFTQNTKLGAFTEKGRELRHARIEETRLMNDLAVERKELELLNRAFEKTERYSQIAVREFLATKKCQSLNHFETFKIAMDSLEQAMKDVDEIDHKWSKAQRQEVAEMRRLVKEMASNSVSDADRKPIELEENTLLNFYAETNGAVKKALSAFKDVKKNHVTVTDALFKKHYKDEKGNLNTIADMSTDPKVMSALGKIEALIQVLEPSLKQARIAEEKAVNMTIALAKDIKDKWLVK